MQISPSLVTPILGVASATSLTLSNPLAITSGGTGSTTATGSGSNVLANTPTLITPNLGVATATSLTLTNPLPVTSGGSGSTTSTGTGANVLANTPTLITPILGAASATSLSLGTPLSVSSGGTGSSTATGTGLTVLQTSPSLITPALGVATASSLAVSGLISSNVSGTGTVTAGQFAAASASLVNVNVGPTSSTGMYIQGGSTTGGIGLTGNSPSLNFTGTSVSAAGNFSCGGTINTNYVVGGNEFQASGFTAPTGPGSYMAYNKGGAGVANFMNQKGSGNSGWDWQTYNSSNSYVNTPMSLDASGNLTLLGTVNASAISASTYTTALNESISGSGTVNVAQMFAPSSSLAVMYIGSSSSTGLYIQGSNTTTGGIGVNGSSPALNFTGGQNLTTGGNLGCAGNISGVDVYSTGYVTPTAQGNYSVWNKSGTGIASFINQRGTGAGGWDWQTYNSSNTYVNTPMALDNNANLNVLGTVTAGNTVVTGYSAPTGQGNYSVWNKSSTGIASFINQKGGGTGGWDWQTYNSSNTYVNTPMAVDPSGNLTVLGTAATSTNFASGYTAPTGQGNYSVWNKSGAGVASFINQKGGGTGGWDWQTYNSSNTYVNTPMALDPSGNLSVLGTLTSSAALGTALKPVLKAPTYKALYNGTTTYTTPSSPAPLYIIVKMIGAGGGGCGAYTSSSPSVGGTGGNTDWLFTGVGTFVAGGGGGGSYGSIDNCTYSGNGGGTYAGFAVTGASAIENATGQPGGDCLYQGSYAIGALGGGVGGNSFYGGGGNGSTGTGAAGTAAGGGGQGGGIDSGLAGNYITGAGGGGGGYLYFYVNNPSGNYTIHVGAGGAGGSNGGSGGYNGGAGSNGVMYVTEYYQ